MSPDQSKKMAKEILLSALSRCKISGDAVEYAEDDLLSILAIVIMTHGWIECKDPICSPCKIIREKNGS